VETEPHPITHRERVLMMTIVVVALGIPLDLKKTLTNLHEEGIAIAQEVSAASI
jgi:hypothetical protein